jgi:hypothetical protein
MKALSAILLSLAVARTGCQVTPTLHDAPDDETIVLGQLNQTPGVVHTYYQLVYANWSDMQVALAHLTTNEAARVSVCNYINSDRDARTGLREIVPQLFAEAELAPLYDPPLAAGSPIGQSELQALFRCYRDYPMRLARGLEIINANPAARRGLNRLKPGLGLLVASWGILPLPQDEPIMQFSTDICANHGPAGEICVPLPAGTTTWTEPRVTTELDIQFQWNRFCTLFDTDPVPAWTDPAETFAFTTYKSCNSQRFRVRGPWQTCKRKYRLPGLTEPVSLDIIHREGDVNGDGMVDYADLDLVTAHNRETAHQGNCQYDLNLDGIINQTDRIPIINRINMQR